jgi:hypothetical protein
MLYLKGDNIMSNIGLLVGITVIVNVCVKLCYNCKGAALESKTTDLEAVIFDKGQAQRVPVNTDGTLAI